MKKTIIFTLLCSCVILTNSYCQNSTLRQKNVENQLIEAISQRSVIRFNEIFEDLDDENLESIKNNMELIKFCIVSVVPTCTSKVLNLYQNANIFDIQRNSILIYFVERLKREEEVYSSKYSWKGKGPSVIDSVVQNFDLLNKKGLNFMLDHNIDNILREIIDYPLALRLFIEKDNSIYDYIMSNKELKQEFYSALISYSKLDLDNKIKVELVINLLIVIDSSELNQKYIKLSKENDYQQKLLEKLI